MIAYITWNVDPIIFSLGPISIRWYSIFFVLGGVLMHQLVSSYYRNEGIKVEHFDRLTVYLIAATVLGARLGHCLFYDFDYYSQHLLEIFLPFQFEPEFAFVGFQGLASHGAVITIILSILLYARKTGLNTWWVLDQVAVGVPLMGCMIRLGNLFNSEILGNETSLPWGFVFTQWDDIPRHPAQLYESLWYLLAFGALYLVHRMPIPRRDGFLFGMFLFLVFLGRFIIEFVKENQSAFEEELFLNMGQLLSIPLIAYGAILMVQRSGAKPPALEQT